jgi:dihydrofolate reductase
MARKMIAALQVSLDGFTQGEDRGEEEWVDSWADALGLLTDVDAFVQGAGMYPGYGDYWAAIHAAPSAVPPFSRRLPYAREVAYARLAEHTPHFVVSRSLSRVSWPPSARVITDFEPLRALKQQPGKNIYVVGGPTLVTGLLEVGLIDELKLIVHPLLLGGGKALFAGVTRRKLELVGVEPADAGRIVVTYHPAPTDPRRHEPARSSRFDAPFSRSPARE